MLGVDSIGIIIKYPYNIQQMVTYDKGEIVMCRQLIKEIRQLDKSINGMPECADHILQYFNITEDMPTPIVYIMQQMGIVALRGSFSTQGLSAYIAVNAEYREKYGSNKIACVNEKESLGHQRFALAHELAHYLFDYDEINNSTYYNTYFIDENGDDNSTNANYNRDGINIECRANKFAAELLMPKELFKRKYKDFQEIYKNKNATIDALSQFFEVSRTAIERRIVEVGKN